MSKKRKHTSRIEHKAEQQTLFNLDEEPKESDILETKESLRPSDSVKKAQAYLKKWKYDIGENGVDGIYGEDTRKALISYMQHSLNAYKADISVDGIYGDETAKALHARLPIGIGSTDTYLIKSIQLALLCHAMPLGWSGGIDGVYDYEFTASTVEAFQKENHISPSGIVDSVTIAKLFE